MKEIVKRQNKIDELQIAITDIIDHYMVIIISDHLKNKTLQDNQNEVITATGIHFWTISTKIPPGILFQVNFIQG